MRAQACTDVPAVYRTEGDRPLTVEVPAGGIFPLSLISGLRHVPPWKLPYHAPQPRILRKRPSRIVTASADKTTRIWDAASGKEIAVLRGHDRQVTSAAFSPDGKRIVTASLDNTARVWDAASGKEIAVLRGHDREVTSAAFSPDGSRIVTASRDKTARIWETHLHTMSVRDLFVQACARLAGTQKCCRSPRALLSAASRLWQTDTVALPFFSIR